MQEIHMHKRINTTVYALQTRSRKAAPRRRALSLTALCALLTAGSIEATAAPLTATLRVIVLNVGVMACAYWRMEEDPLAQGWYDEAMKIFGYSEALESQLGSPTEEMPRQTG